MEQEKTQEEDTISILYFTFNQNQSCLAVGTNVGFQVFRCDPLELLYSQKKGGIGIVEMLYATNLLALVGATDQPTFSPRRLTIWNTNNSTALCEISFTNKILSLRLNKSRLVVSEKDKLHIYDLATMKLLHSIELESSLCRFALSPSAENPYLAYADSIELGRISIYDVNQLYGRPAINAHKSPILKVAISFKGNVIATASCQGTLIRVFSLPHGDKLHTLKRGMASAEIYSMVFDINSGSVLGLTSNSGTLHIFKLDPNTDRIDDGDPEDPPKQLEKKGGILKGAASMLMSNENYEDIIAPDRSIASLNIKYLKQSNILALNQTNTFAFVFTQDGTFTLFNLDIEKGTILEQSQTSIFSLLIDDY